MRERGRCSDVGWNVKTLTVMAEGTVLTLGWNAATGTDDGSPSRSYPLKNFKVEN